MGRDPAGLSIGDRLRLNAEEICREFGEAWRQRTAEKMGCAVNDVGVGPINQNRDSEALSRSNFRVIVRDLRAVDARVTVERFGHWAVGWIDEVVVPISNPGVVQRIESWVTQLEGYAAADDYDLAELEAEEQAESQQWEVDGVAAHTPGGPGVDPDASPAEKVAPLERAWKPLGRQTRPPLPFSHRRTPRWIWCGSRCRRLDSQVPAHPALVIGQAPHSL